MPLIIKQNASLICKQLAHIYNLSLKQGIFPKLLKNAIVIPIFKGGSHDDPSNYRSISILTIFSKVIEKLFIFRLISFVEKHSILHSNRFDFKKNNSTSAAVAHVLSSSLNKCKTNKKVVLALLDLKKAFDFINHDLLLIKLKHYGIWGTPLHWLCSYLSERTQKVKLNNLSIAQSISAGVPRGSLIVPILFNLFINDLFQFNTNNIEFYLYADDTSKILSAETDIELQSLVDAFFFEVYPLVFT